jgi:hypothetical protein
MSDHDTSLMILRRVDTSSNDRCPEVQEIRLVKNARGSYAEVARFGDKVLSLRPVPARLVGMVMAKIEGVGADLAADAEAKKGPRTA